MRSLSCVKEAEKMLYTPTFTLTSIHLFVTSHLNILQRSLDLLFVVVGSVPFREPRFTSICNARLDMGDSRIVFWEERITYWRFCIKMNERTIVYLVMEL